MILCQIFLQLIPRLLLQVHYTLQVNGKTHFLSITPECKFNYYNIILFEYINYYKYCFILENHFVMDQTLVIKNHPGKTKIVYTFQ